MLEKFLNKIKVFNRLRKERAVKTQLENSENKIIISQEEWLRITFLRAEKKLNDFLKEKKLKK